MKPSTKYTEVMQQDGFHSDPAQLHAMKLLDSLQDVVIADYEQSKSLKSRLGKFLGKDKATRRGLYFWGGVGRGKTFLMDIFYQTLPLTEKKRAHFHHFMNDIHHALRDTEQKVDPLRGVARQIADDTKVLCLDEFVITDIGDAMLMAGLLEALFEFGVILVTTSNVPPEGLYKDGLQRARFVPAIELLNQFCQVANIDGGQDYRLLGLQDAELYSIPHDEKAEASIRYYLEHHVIGVQEQETELEINERLLDFVFCAEDTVWFSFEQLCKTTRSRMDYVEIGRMFNTLILSDVEIIKAANDDVARRFISLIDVLYDHRVKLICSAADIPQRLYQGEKLQFEFERTISRLQEMQTTHYLHETHQSW